MAKRKTKKSRIRKTTRKRKSILLLNRKVKKKTRRKITRVRKNPTPAFEICAILEKSGRRYYFRQSTKSFVPDSGSATHYKSRLLAERTAKNIVGMLPSNIKAISVDRV